MSNAITRAVMLTVLLAALLASRDANATRPVKAVKQSVRHSSAAAKPVLRTFPRRVRLKAMRGKEATFTRIGKRSRARLARLLSNPKNLLAAMRSKNHSSRAALDELKSHLLAGNGAVEELLRQPEWKRLFVRSSDSQVADNYLLNHSAALLLVFGPWFEGSSDDPFGDMLLRYHKMACLGPTGDTPYEAPHLNYSSANKRPGVFNDSDGVRIVGNAMSKVRDGLRSSGKKKLSKLDVERAVSRLSDFHWAFVSRPYPFDGLNNSVAMAMVNYSLIRHGLAGIEHGKLDITRDRYRTRDYRYSFNQAIEAANPAFTNTTLLEHPLAY